MKSNGGDAEERRGHLRFVATLAINGIGVAAVIGILYALITGQDYHPIIVLAACLFLLLRPLLYWTEGRTKKTADKNLPS